MKAKKISVDLSLEAINTIASIKSKTGFSQSDIVDGMLNILKDEDVSVVCSMSSCEKNDLFSVIRKTLIASIYPQNSQALSWILQLYSSDNSTLLKTYQHIFEYMSAGIEWKAAHGNGYKLVEHFGWIIDTDTMFEDMPNFEREKNYIVSQFSSIIDLIKNTSFSNNVSHKTSATDFEITRLKQLLSSFEKCNFGDICRVLSEYWEIVGNFTRTYRLLGAIARLSPNFTDNQFERDKLRRILIEISLEW